MTHALLTGSAHFVVPSRVAVSVVKVSPFGCKVHPIFSRFSSLPLLSFSENFVSCSTGGSWQVGLSSSRPVFQNSHQSLSRISIFLLSGTHGGGNGMGGMCVARVCARASHR